MVSDLTICVETLCLMEIFIHSFMPRNEHKEWEEDTHEICCWDVIHAISMDIYICSRWVTFS